MPAIVTSRLCQQMGMEFLLLSLEVGQEDWSWGPALGLPDFRVQVCAPSGLGVTLDTFRDPALAVLQSLGPRAALGLAGGNRVPVKPIGGKRLSALGSLAGHCLPTLKPPCSPLLVALGNCKLSGVRRRFQLSFLSAPFSP